LAGYIFSPPYNGWAVRPGLVAIVAGGERLPAAVIEPVHETVFGYEGRRVRACVHAPDGTTLRAYMRVQERPELGWLPWIEERALEGDRLELCFRSPRAELSGSVRLRFDLQAPDGGATTVYSPDTLTSLPGAGTCTPSDTICCDAPATAPAEACVGPEGACEADAGGRPDAGAAANGSTHEAAGGAAEPQSGACSAAAHSRPPRPGRGWALLLAVAVALLRRRRAPRRGIPRARPAA
jgi:hypothetical protein